MYKSSLSFYGALCFSGFMKVTIPRIAFAAGVGDYFATFAQLISDVPRVCSHEVSQIDPYCDKSGGSIDTLSKTNAILEAIITMTGFHT